jgi:hypothetical protein
MSNPFILVVREVYEDGGKHYIEVGPGRDGFGVEIRTVGEKNAEYYGPIRLCLPKEMAAKVGRALIDCSDEVDS